jgi:hypothetical protein
LLRKLLGKTQSGRSRIRGDTIKTWQVRMMVEDGCKWLTIIGAVILLVLNPLTVSQSGNQFGFSYQ